MSLLNKKDFSDRSLLVPENDDVLQFIRARRTGNTGYTYSNELEKAEHLALPNALLRRRMFFTSTNS